MDNIKEMVLVEIQATPQMVAELFCSMNEDEQADFFNSVADKVKHWRIGEIETQLNGVSESFILNDDGRKLMKLIGDYSCTSK